MRLLIAFSLMLAIFCQSCSISDSEKVDCGYFGINQAQCEAKQCCWVPKSSPSQLVDTPWCFYSSGKAPCGDTNWNYSGSIGFDTDFNNKMMAYYLANINIENKGGVAAAPDKNTPGGSYYYHWMRDAGLTMRAYQELHNFNLSVISPVMKAYTSFVLKVQDEKNPYDSDVRINPKFELPNGEVYVGGWCRPQTDGPGLTSAALIMFANNLLDNGDTSFVKENLWTDGAKHGGAIKYDLDWVVNNWSSSGCDLWEEVQSNDFFWNRMAFVHSLSLAEKFATRMGDSSMASKYASTRSSIEATLDSHWSGSFMTESSNRQRDGAVLHAFTSFPEKYGFTDSKIPATIKAYAQTFCLEYQINQNENTAGLPGVLIGRYPGDSYAGGNPWQLLTAVLAELFYRGAVTMLESNFDLSIQAKQEWSNLLKIPADATNFEFASAASKAGDAVMYRLWQHVKSDGGRIDEQIGKTTGLQASAKGLTWSYGNILTALKVRNGKLAQLLRREQVA